MPSTSLAGASKLSSHEPASECARLVRRQTAPRPRDNRFLATRAEEALRCWAVGLVRAPPSFREAISGLRIRKGIWKLAQGLAPNVIVSEGVRSRGEYIEFCGCGIASKNLYQRLPALNSHPVNELKPNAAAQITKWLAKIGEAANVSQRAKLCPAEVRGIG